jgi:2-methylcitrate dehydratase PrpD
MAARVVVETEAGERHERFVRYPKGDPENPLTWDELAAKFLALAGPVVGPDRCIEIKNLVRHGSAGLATLALVCAAESVAAS